MPETTPITPTQIDPKRRYLCRHIFTEGHRCGSPALRGQSLCYNHNRSRREAGISGKSGTFPMPRVDDRASIQLALFEVLSRLAGGDIEYKRGSILLYGLQIASSNLPRHAKIDAEQQPQVEEITADYLLGDLAPITEIPAEQAVILTLSLPKGKNPRILPEAPQPSEHTQPLAAEISTPATNRNPETFSPLHTVSSPQTITLAAVQAVSANADPSNPAPRTSNLRRFPPPIHPFRTPYNRVNDFVQSAFPTSPRRLFLPG